jgi:DNA-binding NtrC family response regulator
LEPSCILVVGAEDRYVLAAMGALREGGWNVVGTTDPWEAITLVSRRSFSVIVRDQDLSGFGALDFFSILSDDPMLQEIPTVAYSRSCFDPSGLPAAVQQALNPRFPSEEPSSSDTRFVRRRRSVLAPT